MSEKRPVEQHRLTVDFDGTVTVFEVAGKRAGHPWYQAVAMDRLTGEKWYSAKCAPRGAALKDLGRVMILDGLRQNRTEKVWDGAQWVVR